MAKTNRRSNLRDLFIFLLFIYSSSQSSPVLAAPTPMWQAPYVGIYFGGGFGSNNISTDAGEISGSSYFPTTADINAVNSAGSSTQYPSSPIVGIEAGHDWVWKHLVYGVVLDYGALPLSASNNVSNASYPGGSGQFSESTSLRSNWLFTLRARFGYALTQPWPSLIYLTAGPALTQLKVSNSFSDNSATEGVGSSQNTENEIGWTAGAGMEVAIYSHVSLGLEYLYVHAPSVDSVAYVSNTQGGFGIPPQSLTSPLTTKGQFNANLLKVELNYRFGE